MYRRFPDEHFELRANIVLTHQMLRTVIVSIRSETVTVKSIVTPVTRSRTYAYYNSTWHLVDQDYTLEARSVHQESDGTPPTPAPNFSQILHNLPMRLIGK